MSATFACSTVDPRTIGGLMKSYPAIAALPPCVNNVSDLRLAIVSRSFAVAGFLHGKRRHPSPLS